VAQKRFSKGKQQPPHVSGQELLEGIRQHALDEFGPMTMTVFEEWGLAQCDDFGAIVFNMVEHSLLGKTEEDSMEDFKGGYEFFDAFRKPFLPSGKLPKKKRKKSEPASSEQGKN